MIGITGSRLWLTMIINFAYRGTMCVSFEPWFNELDDNYAIWMVIDYDMRVLSLPMIDWLIHWDSIHKLWLIKLMQIDIYEVIWNMPFGLKIISIFKARIQSTGEEIIWYQFDDDYESTHKNTQVKIWLCPSRDITPERRIRRRRKIVTCAYISQ